MIYLNWKVILIGAAIIIAVGYGPYARYLKEGVITIQPQLLAKELLSECSTHLANPDPAKSKEFISRAKDALPKLKRADAASVALGEANRDKIPSASLSQCLDKLNRKLINCGTVTKLSITCR